MCKKLKGKKVLEAGYRFKNYIFKSILITIEILFLVSGNTNVSFVFVINLNGTLRSRLSKKQILSILRFMYFVAEFGS